MAKPAFPGAQGYGSQSQGGRGGRIIMVTTLADAGPGSLRACIDARGPRLCVFRVGGVIRYRPMRPEIRNPFITIAGETAPGGGILITHEGGKGATTPFVIKNTHDVVVRHVRVRLDRFGELRRADSAFVIENSRNVILDHVSASWARDENLGTQAQNDSITVSWSIFAEGVPRHDKCALLSSDPKGPQRLSFVHNICAHNGDRNPDINFQPKSCVDVVNNVLYNGQRQFSEVWESYGGTPVNIVGNYYKRGPNTAATAWAIDRLLIESKGRARIYYDGNVLDGQGLVVAPSVAPARVAQPVCPLSVRPMSAHAAYAAALARAGAFPRDAFDSRVVQEVRTGTGRINRPDRTLPPIANGTPYADKDQDGMSDSWERAHRSNPNMADPWADADRDGWANIEDFLDFASNERIAGRSLR
ncbi:MAG TPA: pectate lyase [Sphingobium sp.]|nr:pectate lyase [Sphingobium sp.]